MEHKEKYIISPLKHIYKAKDCTDLEDVNSILEGHDFYQIGSIIFLTQKT